MGIPGGARGQQLLLLGLQSERWGEGEKNKQTNKKKNPNKCKYNTMTIAAKQGERVVNG